MVYNTCTNRATICYMISIKRTQAYTKVLSICFNTKGFLLVGEKER